MSSTIIYKQSFKARDKPSTAGLNVRHLQYIATRPGAVYNHGCGFGLWGQLPGDGGIRIQNDLQRAKRIVREASADHTLYRAIISVGKKDAENYGLYHRERWEQLVNDQIRTIAREMDIKPENLCWCASMHYAKHHPHVHILYWDNGDQPRPEFIKKELFEQKTERIRAAFAGTIHREEIRELQQEQREQLNSLRTAVQAMCREANPEKALDLPRLYRSDRLEGLTQKLAKLLQNLPAKGSLRYAYLTADYKAMVNKLVDECLKLPELAQEYAAFESGTRQISELYANGADSITAAVNKARDRLYTELGNEVMTALRQIKEDLQASPPKDHTEVLEFIEEIIAEAAPLLDSYQELLNEIPLNGVSSEAGDYRDAINRVVDDLLSDARIRLRFQSYAIQEAGIDLAEKDDAPRKSIRAESADEKKPHILNGKILSDREWEDYTIAFRGIKRDLRNAITRDVLGWLRTGLYDSPELRLHLQDFVRNIVREIVPPLDSYQNLKELLPAERVPIRAMETQIQGYHEAMNSVMGTVLMDARIRTRVHAFALELSGITLEQLPDVDQMDAEQPSEQAHVLYGKVLSNQEWEDYQDAYREAKREIRRSITEHLREEVGWTDEAVHTGSAMLVCSMMRLLSQAAHQRQAGAVQARNNLKTRSKDKSREAKKDYWATQSHASEWGDGYD